MKTKLLALLLLVAILTTMLASCEVLEFVNHMLNIFGPGDDSDTNIDLDINIGGTTAHVHTEGVLPATESTCTTHGLTEGRYCTSCEKVLVPQEEAPLKAHTYDNSVDKYCNVCGYERDIDCSHQGTTEFLPAIESTCTEAGLTQGVKCTLCGEIIVAQESLPIKEHVSSDWIIDYVATTEQEGLRHIECTVCGTITKQEVIPVILPSSEVLTYELNGDESSYSITGIETCTSTHIVIPDTYQGKPVTQIAVSAFKNCTSLIEVVIGKNITTIGTFAFSGCSNLVTITMGSSVAKFNGGVFENCTSLKNVYYNGSIENWCSIYFYSIYCNPLWNGGNLYMNGSLVTELVIPNTVTSINTRAFKGCVSLQSVKIPDSVTEIGTQAFYDCVNITKIDIPNSVTDIKSEAFWGCDSIYEITIPNSVINLGQSAFSSCDSLKNVTILASITTINNYSFNNCKSLESITIPSSVTNIGSSSSVFFACESLKNIYFTGTIEQWNSISKTDSWNQQSGKYTIYCTDGQIAKDGTITYN